MSLTTYKPTSVFARAVELAEASVEYRPEDHANPPTELPEEQTAETLDTVLRWHGALDAVWEASNRLKRALGATGPLDGEDHLRQEAPVTWEAFQSRFKYANHSPVVRNALWKLANAAVDLSGYATVRVQAPVYRERGLRLLAHGLAQLWSGLTGPQRDVVRYLLVRSHVAVGWPPAPSAEPPPYDGPPDIPDADQYRVIDVGGGFI